MAQRIGYIWKAPGVNAWQFRTDLARTFPPGAVFRTVVAGSAILALPRDGLTDRQVDRMTWDTDDGT